MISNRPRLLMSVPLGLALAIAAESKADPLLPTHAFARAVGGNAGQGFDVRIEGNGALDTGLRSYESGGRENPDRPPFESGTARAITDINAARFLRASSSVGGPPTGAKNGDAYSESAWRDVAFTATAAPVLRLNFIVDADLFLQPLTEFGTFTTGEARLGLTTSTDPRSFPAFGGFPQFFARLVDADEATIPGGPRFDFGEGGPNGEFWDSIHFDGGHVTGTFHIDTPFDAELGGYGWAVTLQAFSATLGTTAVVNALNTLSLTSVTLTDGTPVAVTFDSGLQLTAVPEPSSLALAVTGSAGLLALSRRRAARAKATRP